MASSGKEFTWEELERFNGQDEPLVCIAYQGRVYDVSGSKFWKTGIHMKRHQSGTDLTQELMAAPHGPEVFETMPQVGVMKEEKIKDPMDAGVPDILLKLFETIPMLRRHPHPMTVHFPMAFCLVVPLFNVLYLLSGYAPLEATAFHLLVISLPATLAAAMTGPITWWLNYGAKMTLYIRAKLMASCVLILLLTAALLWRLLVPDILQISNISGLMYLLLSFAFPVPLGLLGWFGAKMTFPD